MWKRDVGVCVQQDGFLQKQITSEPPKNSGSCRCVFRKSRVRQNFLQWGHLILSPVLRCKVSCRDNTSWPWSFSEAEFPIDVRVTLVVLDYVVGQLYSIQYKGIFGMPDQGQMLYLWQGQTVESGLRCWAQHLIGIWGGGSATSSPHHHCIPT